MKKVIFIFLLLCSIHFWGFAYLPQKFHNATNTFSLLIMGYSFIYTIYRDDLQFRNAIIVYFIGLITNIISAYVNNNQDFLDTFLALGSFYFILFYFSLHQLKPGRKYIENIIIIFAIIYSIIYIVQIYAYPKEIFLGQMRIDRGTLRLRIIGNGFLVLAFLLSLNRYLLNQKLKNILLVGFFFLILLKGGFRTLTIAAVMLAVLMSIRLAKYATKNIPVTILALVLFATVIYSRSTSAIIKNMIYTTQDQRSEGDNYIRFRQFDFFFSSYPENRSYYLFGGGFPAGNSFYNQKMKFFRDKYGFYFVDLGLFGFYIVIGAISLLGMLWFTLKAIFVKLKPELIYLNFYFLYLLLVSFTTMEIFRSGVFAVEAIVLYMIDLALKEEKHTETNVLEN